MRNFTKDTAKKIMANEIDAEMLLARYPEYKKEALDEFGAINEKSGADEIIAVIDRYKAKAKTANDRINKSGFNEKTIRVFLPDIIKARIALHTLGQWTAAVSSTHVSKNVRFNFWDGTILQRLLFHQKFERKPVSLGLFRFFWPFITDKKILMPLVNQRGIYCFYSKPLIRALAQMMAGKTCLEIAAGDGTLTKFLQEAGVDCKATDDYSWSHYITYPAFVEKIEARAALQRDQPEIVICSWPVQGNAFEKMVFKTASVSLYIVIGTKNPLYAGDFAAYTDTEAFTMETDVKLSALVLPPSDGNAVYIFRRKKEREQDVH